MGRVAIVIIVVVIIGLADHPQNGFAEHGSDAQHPVYGALGVACVLLFQEDAVHDGAHFLIVGLCGQSDPIVFVMVVVVVRRCLYGIVRIRYARRSYKLDLHQLKALGV